MKVGQRSHPNHVLGHVREPSSRVTPTRQEAELPTAISLQFATECPPTWIRSVHISQAWWPRPWQPSVCLPQFSCGTSNTSDPCCKHTDGCQGRGHQACEM